MVQIFMLLPLNNVGQDLLLGCLFVWNVRLFIRSFIFQSDIVTTISHERLEQF